MDLRVVLICLVTACGRTQELIPYYKPGVGSESRDAKGQASKLGSGFVQPLDFSIFTQEFATEEKVNGGAPFGRSDVSPDFGEESKKAGAFQIATSEFAPFFPDRQNANKTGFVQPVQFASSFDKGTNAKVYKTNIGSSYETSESSSGDQVPRATEDDGDSDSHYNPSKGASFKHSTIRRVRGPAKPYSHGKSSYPAPNQKRNPPYYYPGSTSQHKDVEMILPEDKVLFLPMINGKLKPYDGYRAAPENEGYETFERDDRKETRKLREKRLNEGDIIYGRPKIALSQLYHRRQRSPAEYYGGIHPYYDYSDAKLSVGGDTDPDGNRGKKSSASNQKKKKAYPKKHGRGSKDKPYDPYDPYKYPKESPGRRNKEKDGRVYASEESSEEESDEDTEETKADGPFYKYTYDDSISIPPLEIKRYPYEKKVRDSKVEGSRRDESYDNVDEYTAGYETYVKTLPSDLEAYFGSAGLTDRFSVEATENLESNKNCKKVDSPPPESEKNSDEINTEEQAETQVCYICSDPKTGDSYEQCAYRSQPKAQKYFFGGTTSFQSNETAEPTTYRYKRSARDYPYRFRPYALEESESAESERYGEPEDTDSKEYHKQPKKKYKRQRTAGSNLSRKKHSKVKYNNDPTVNFEEASSTKRGRRAKLEQPPRSYDGPKYTYEGPEDTYEGPARPYEGPRETYEGPINQEYYDTVDERIKDEEEEEEEVVEDKKKNEEPSKQESQGSSPTDTRYYDEHDPQRPKKRQSYPSHYNRSYRPSSKYSDDGYREENFRPSQGYTSDYRFGPEHFVDEIETEDIQQNEKIKPAASPVSPEKRGPHKFPASESRSTAATDRREKEESIGEVKVFKNGDVCQKKRKEGLICMVCKNEKTAATYEQCQYSTKPKEKYYAYGSQKSFTTKNPDSEKKEEEEESESDQFPERSDIVEKKILITTQSKVFGYDPNSAEGLAVAESKNSPRVLPKDVYGDHSDNVETLPEEQYQNETDTKDFRESIERIEPRDGIEGLEEYLYDAEDTEKKATEDEKRSYGTYDDYFRELFSDFSKSSEPVSESDEKEESESERHLTFDPFANVKKFHEENSGRYSNEEEEDSEEDERDAEASRPEELRLKDRKSRIPLDFFSPYNEENHKKDLEKALGEFQNKDWSNCKKIVKKKLTCYQCVDKNGVNNEECMYVEASQPILRHLAYHEKKELKPGAETAKKAENQTVEVEQPENGEKSLKRFRKAKNSQAELIQIAEPLKDAEYVEKSVQKGDFEGAEKLPIEESEATDAKPEQRTPTPKVRKQKRHPKKRNKTIKNETTTQRFEKIRKRKFPLKKFAENEEIQLKNRTENGSFGVKDSETKVVDSSAVASFNQTGINLG